MGRALANWLIDNGVKVIPNVRLGDERTYSFGFDGLYKGDVIAIGTIGTSKIVEERKLLVNAIKKTIEVLDPVDIVIYGSLPKEIKECYPKVTFHIFDNYNYKKKEKKQNG